MIIGIDLGTTNSLAAYMTADGPRLIPNAVGENLTPSVVGAAPDGKILVGRAAKELRVTRPERCASVFKRYMGSDWKTTLDGREFTPERLSALVLQSLKLDAEVHFDRPVTEAVITVPAYFNEHQRKATMRAGEIAGLHVRRIINEPTAAAIAYGYHHSEEEKLLLVFDLGGGTFDVSLVDLFEGTVEVKASSGNSFLGGEDFTVSLAARILEGRGQVFERAEVERPLLVSRLLHQCELAKCRLSSQPETRVRIPNEQGELAENCPEVVVTRAQFETWTEKILERVDLPLRRALGDAGVAQEQIAEILLVGGATRMPAVVERLARQFGKPPQQRLNPDEVVALGAAVQAGLIACDKAVEDLVVTDVAPFTLGTNVCKELGSEMRPGYFLPVIHRNTTIPISRVKRLATVAPNQPRVEIGIYQGENRRVDDNLLLAQFMIDGIPKGPPRDVLDLRFTYDLNGVLEVEATVIETGRRVSHVVTRYARDMSAEQIREAVRQMQALKIAPREEAQNRLLLQRAERIFRELPLTEKGWLGQLLDAFESALEIGDREAIEQSRQALCEFLGPLDEEQGGA